MIRREDGELIAECSQCGDEFAGDCEDDFHALIRDLKAEGWKITKDGDEWIHTCPECQ